MRKISARANAVRAPRSNANEFGNINLVHTTLHRSLLSLKFRAIERLGREDRILSDLETPQLVRRLDVRSWLFRLFAWDGVLPVCIVLIPSVISFLIPERRGAIEITAVVLPITAFFIRFRAGKRHIESNNCGEPMRVLQLCVFCLGILVLVVVDAFVVLSHVMPGQGGSISKEDLIILGVVISIYLTSMAFAMYPGRRWVREAHSAIQSDEWEHDPYRVPAEDWGRG